MAQKSNSNTLLSNSFFYTFSGLFGKCLHFFLLPVYTRLLTTSDYGIQNLIFAFNSVMSYVILLCIDSAAIKFYTENKDDKNKLKEFYGTALCIISFSSILILVLCFIFHDFLSATFFEGIEFYPYIVIGMGILVLESFFTLHRRILEAQQEGKKVAIISLCIVVLVAAFTLVLVGLFHRGAVGLLLSSLIVYFLAAVFVIVDAKRHDMVKLCFRIKLAKEMLVYSVPLLPHQLSGYIATLVSSVLLNSSGSLGSVGLYGVASQFSSVIDTFQDSVSRAYRPWLFDRLAAFEEKDKEEIGKISLLLCSFYTLIYGAIGLFGLEMIVIMTSVDFHEAWRVMPILVAGFSIKSIYYFYVAQCLFYPRTSSRVFIASMSGSLANVVLSFIIVPVMGMYGSAIAYCSSHLICTSLVVFLNRKNADIGYNLFKMVRTVAIALLFICIGILPGFFLVGDKWSWPFILYKLFICLIYLIYLFFSNRRSIRELIGNEKASSLFKMIRIKKTNDSA